MRAIQLSNPRRVVTPTLESYSYNSIHEFVEALKSGEHLPKSDAHREGKAHWYGSYDIAEAYKIIAGFNNKVQEIKTGLIKLQSHKTELTPQANKYSGRVNVASMLSGVENCRVRFRDEEQPSKLLTLYVQMNALANVSSTNFVNKAIAIANAVNNLEKEGIKVELVGYSYSSMTPKVHSLVTIKIKSYEDTLSLGQLYGVLAPSTFRRLMFRHLELFWASSLVVPEGYGYSADWVSNPKGSVNIPRSKSYDTLDEAVKYVNHKIIEGYEN